MDLLLTLASSAVISGVVGAVAGYLGQRRLAERQAAINYQSSARTRLYEVIGPLRYQMLVACKDVLRRINNHHLDAYDMQPDHYYAHSFLYRLLRPLAIGELVEREMNYADFSVDADVVGDLLRFQTAAYRFLTGSDPVEYHSGLDWTSQSQHVFRDNLRVAARRLIQEDAQGRQFVVDYGAFAEMVRDPGADHTLSPMACLFATCKGNLFENPVWWVRIVGYAYACQWFLNRNGQAAGFATRDLPIQAMLAAPTDAEITAHLGDYPEIFDRVMNESL